jgi:O-antigen/teichoic acid export membrane protein
VLLDTVRESGTLVVFGSMFGQTSTGYLTQTLRVLRAPVGLVGQAVAQVYFPKASRESAEGRSIGRLTRRIVVGLVAVSIPIYLSVLLAGPELFTLVLGPQWKTSGQYAQILSPWLALTLVSSSLSLLPVIRRQQHSALLLNAIETAARLAALVGGGLLGGAKGALIGVSAVGVLLVVTRLAWYRALAGSDEVAGIMPDGTSI